MTGRPDMLPSMPLDDIMGTDLPCYVSGTLYSKKNETIHSKQNDNLLLFLHLTGCTVAYVTHLQLGPELFICYPTAQKYTNLLHWRSCPCSPRSGAAASSGRPCGSVAWSRSDPDRPGVSSLFLLFALLSDCEIHPRKSEDVQISAVCITKAHMQKLRLPTHRLLVVPSVLVGVFVPAGDGLCNLEPLVPQLPLRIPQNFHLGLRPNALLDVRIEHVYPTLLDLLSDPTWKLLGNFGPLIVPRGDQHGDDVVLFLAPSNLDEAGLECLRIIDSHCTCEKIATDVTKSCARERKRLCKLTFFH